MEIQELKFTHDNFSKLKMDKNTTIRLGYKQVFLGPVRLLNEENNEVMMADIIEIRHVNFHRLGLVDAVMDGFNSEEDLRAELELVYKKDIDELDVVTVIRFKRSWIK